MVDSTERNEVIQRYLSGYRAYSCLIEKMKRGEFPDELNIRAEAFAIRRSVLRLPDSREKLLLYNHYIKGETLEYCAELIGVSRRTVFRLKKKAVELYAKYNPENEAVRVFGS